MQLVEQHVIGRDDPRYAVIDEAAFKSIVEQARAALEKKNKKAA